MDVSSSRSEQKADAPAADGQEAVGVNAILSWLVVAIAGAGILVWFLTFLPFRLNPAVYLALHTTIAAAAAAFVLHRLCLRPLFARISELQRRGEQIDRLRYDLQSRLTERDAELTATRSKFENETLLRQKAETESRRLLQEMDQRVTARTAKLDEAMRDLKADLLERKRSGEALQESEKRYRHLIEIADLGIWTINAQGRTNFINPRGAQLLGYTVPETLGRPPEDLVVLDDLPPELRPFDLQQTGRRQSLEFRMRQKEGREVWMRGSVAPITGENSEYLGALVLFADITSHKQEELRLQHQATLLHTAQDAVVLCDSKLHILSWNTGATRLYGWTPEEVLGRDVFELLAVAESAPRKQDILHGLRQQRAWRGELSHQSKSGAVLAVDARFTLSHATNGRAESILLLATDMTQARREQTQLLKEQRRESAALLASGLAHDLNNFLAPIVLSAQLLRAKRLDDEDQSLLAAIESGAERTAELVKQSLIFARGIEGDRVRVEPAKLIKEILDIARETFPRNVQIITDVPPETWGVTGDPGQLHQVILKLCVQCRDAMPSGGVLSVKARNLQPDDPLVRMGEGLKPEPHLLIEVQDTGAAIPATLAERIFEPFFSAKERRQSASLASSIVLGIVRSHGGVIEVRSRPGAGMAFQVLLPAITEASVQAPSAAIADAPDGRGELILMVEDEAGLREVTCKTLNRHGYEVLSAGDGLEALGLLAENQGRVKLVLTSISMPSMDGPSLARAARKIDPRVPIIASTTLGRSPGQGDKLAALQSVGIRRLLAKPYSTRELLRAIRDELGVESKS